MERKGKSNGLIIAKYVAEKMILFPNLSKTLSMYYGSI